MDTRYWGPDGWKLLHSIAVSYPTRPQKRDKMLYSQFFETIMYVLPCIYCRNSFQEYFDQLPIEHYLANNLELSYWLYLMHNKVNDKLRKQNLLKTRDPEFESVHSKNQRMVQSLSETESYLPGWDFLYCIMFDYTSSKAKMDPVRKKHYIIFFNTLSEIIPFKAIRTIMSNYIAQYPIQEAIHHRSALKRWFYEFEKTFCQANYLKYPTFKTRCDSVELYRATCKGKNDPKPTCRVSGTYISPRKMERIDVGKRIW